MTLQTNRFCWHGALTADPDRSQAFYTEVMGWPVVTAMMGDQQVSMFAPGDEPFAHFGLPPNPELPNHWESYLRVDDVDASTASARDNGGGIVQPPTDIPPGRFSVVASPSGATVCLFHEADDATEHHPGGVGGVHWVELQSTNLDADLSWLRKTFGFETEAMNNAGSGPYFVLKTGDHAIGGAMANPAPGAPAAWMVWFHVADLDATLHRVKSQGGKVLSPIMDMASIGRMAVIEDSVGAVCGVITPAQLADDAPRSTRG